MNAAIIRSGHPPMAARGLLAAESPLEWGHTRADGGERVTW
jgi:hypothetical protein